MSLGYVPPVPRLRTAPRRVDAWVLPARADYAARDAAPSKRGWRGLILDLDDTLYPRERFVMSGFAAVARHVGSAHGVSAEMVYGVLVRASRSEARGSEIEAMCDRFAIPRSSTPALVDVFRRHLPAIHLNHDVAPTLQALRAAGWRLALLTNGLPSVQFRKVAALGLSSLVDDVIYAEEHVASGKPAAAAFRVALGSLDLAPEQCVCVANDLVRDVRGARALGLRTIRIARPGEGRPVVDDADVVVDMFARVPQAAALLLDMVTADVA